ncbi:ketoacyl-ACP synthase III [Paraburkholderia sp. FT54]|uniref:3-oxoacyl-ACP synthase III family protein n=1 Tax=Paraburkholderia sp. FT54 TaxID=3074437 RepID=UPI0028774047|nr:ketoacyl-ACP synthase III [Paraburkholderia sp. FT54]WNC88094.1 ketoacyl-ACP synthase III [Paraburkholderia sp. FT54]
MSLRIISGAAIQAVTAAVPEKKTTLKDFSLLYGEREAGRVARTTGVRSKSYAGNLSATDLITAACKNLFSAKITSAAEIDGLIVVTQTPDDWSPGAAFTIHCRLGLSQDCLVTDLNAGCSGYLSALFQAGALVASGACKKVLVCTGDVMSKLISDDDRHVAMLFGDGASATLVGQGTEQIEFMCAADGSGRNLLGAKLRYSEPSEAHVCAEIHGLHMDGEAVMNFALARVPAMVKSLLQATRLTPATLDLLVLHQANEFMLTYLRRIIGVDAAKVPIDIDGFGNTSSTSIPLVLSRHAAIGSPQAKNVVLCGFGVGLSWLAAKVDLQNTVVVPPCVVPDLTHSLATLPISDLKP